MAEINWEERAKKYRLENKRLNKKVKEVTTSRDGWKKKATDRKEEIEEYKRKISIVKKNINQITSL